MEQLAISFSSLSFSSSSFFSAPRLLPPPLPLRPPPTRRLTVRAAGRSKKKAPQGRIEGNSAIRREAKIAARKRGHRIAENRIQRQRDSTVQFSEEELNLVGLGYDRMVRFMAPDDPNIRHPHDWFKYGRYGPYSWRGIVVGPPIRGEIYEAQVSLIGNTSHEEFEEIERMDMCADYDDRRKAFVHSPRFYWLFVRHPKFSPRDKPWEQWTLAAEVALEVPGEQRLDKWSLMGRLGNRARSMITQCAAWVRPDIIYVRRPLFHCRFESQHGFFGPLAPLLDPLTEGEFLFELKDPEGRVVDRCTYFGGLCRIVKIGQKAFVDDVVRAYERLDEEGKSRCLEFLLQNHPLELLHPYTKEWKAKLEEMELGCDAPDDSDGESAGRAEEVVDWIEDEAGDGTEKEFIIYDDHQEEEEAHEEDEGGDDEELEAEDDVKKPKVDEGGDDTDWETEDDFKEPEESQHEWERKWTAALKDAKAMERLVTRKMMAMGEEYKRERRREEEAAARRESAEMEKNDASGDEGEVGTLEMKEEDASEDEKEQATEKTKEGVGVDQKRTTTMYGGEDWEAVGYRPGPKRRVIKSKIPPELFLRAAVRPFTYRNLVKEIVLMRHAIIDGDIAPHG